uniref:ShKT domain-containing protein n=1 Tax=Macrostomum lignano TaxID=282301 RepID=A0A1I8FT62_9PLAT
MLSPAQREGCRCKRGFVLDSSNRCVPPKECECLTKLCLDRMPRKKCLKWRARGRCKVYPEVMARFCRLTCGHCETRCGENQFSDKLCKNILRQGKCSKPLYKAVCAATCGRNKCRCPNKRRIESKCSTRYKNRIIKSIRYLPGPHGKCIKSTVVRYEPCGACPSIAKTKLQPCNYCKGVRTGKRTVQYRETHGKHRCLRRVTRVSKKLSAAAKCVKHTELVRVTKVFKAAEKCTKCKRITRRQVVKKI